MFEHEVYFSMSLDTAKDIKKYLTNIYTIPKPAGNSKGDTYSTSVISVTKKEYPEKTSFIVKYQIYKNLKLLKIDSLDIDIKTTTALYSNNKTPITIAKINNPIKVYANSIAANSIWVNMATNEVTIGNFLKVNDIDFAKKLLSTRKLTEDELKKYIERDNYAKTKFQWIEENNKRILSSLGKINTEWVINEIKSIKLDRKVFDKLKILLKRDDVPEKIDGEFIDTLLYVFNNKLDKMTPLDIQFTELETKLVQYLKNETRSRNIRTRIYKFLTQRESLYSSAVQNEINRFFSGIKKDDIRGELQQTQDTTPLSSAIQGSKIYFLDNKTSEQQLVSMDNMMGIIDPVHTHEARANLDNKLTNAVKISGESMTIKVYDTKFNELNIPIGEYMTNPIMSYDHIDYRRKQIKKNPENAYNCYLYGDYVVRKLQDIKYLRHMDSMVSKSTALIPFLNKTYVGRGMYGAIQLGQSVPTRGADKTIISTGSDKALYNETLSHVKAPVSGEIIDYKEGIAVIKGEDGKNTPVQIKEFNESMNHTFNKYVPNFRVGQKVKEGDVLFYLNTFKKDGSIALTTPALVMIGTYYSMENNDSSVISESFAKKLMCEEQEVIDIPLKKGKFEFKINEFAKDIFKKIGLPRPGDTIRHNEELFTMGVIPDTDEAKIYKKLKGIELIRAKTYYVPFEIYEGTVTKIEIVNNTKKNYSGKYEDVLQELDKECFKTQRSLIGKSFKADASDFEDDKSIDYIIRIYITFWRNVTKGGKLSLLNGNKSTISNILRDDQMPRLKDGRVIDVIISPLSEVPRMLGSEPYLLYLGKLAYHLYNRIANNDIDKNMLIALEFLFPQEHKIDPQKILRKYGNNGYLRFTFMPYDTELNEDKLLELLSLCKLDQKEKVWNPIGKNYIRGLVDVGYLDIMLLYLMASKKFRVSPTIIYTDKTQGYGSLRKIKNAEDHKYEEGRAYGQSLSETRKAMEGHGATEEFKKMIREREIDPSNEIKASFDQLLIRLS